MMMSQICQGFNCRIYGFISYFLIFEVAWGKNFFVPTAKSRLCYCLSVYKIISMSVITAIVQS